MRVYTIIKLACHMNASSCNHRYRNYGGRYIIIIATCDLHVTFNHANPVTSINVIKRHYHDPYTHYMLARHFNIINV